MPENRGFHFLAGIATLWLMWRLYTAGIIFQAVAYSMGYDELVSSGPGAIIVSFIIEGIITIGWVVTLLLSGLWDAAVVVGRLVADAFGAGHGYLKAAQESKPAIATDAPVVEVIDDGKTPEQRAIELLSQQLVEISKRLPPEKQPAKVAK